MSFDVFALRKKTAIKILLKSLIWAFALFGGLFILLLIAILGYVNSSSVTMTIPDRAILTVDLNNTINEVKDDSLMAEVIPSSYISFNEFLTILETAAYDNRVQAIAAKINDTNLGLAQTEELYQAILNFRKTGKKAYIFAPGFGNFVGGTSEYYLATAFDEITMLPNTDIGLSGIGLEIPFVRSFLDKIGVIPDFYARYEYKGGMASFTDKVASLAFKENMNNIVADLNRTLFVGMSKGRGAKAKELNTFLVNDDAPVDDIKAQNNGLIDKILYEYDWINEIKSSHKA
jgi:protease-4